MPDLKHILVLTADAGFGHRTAANAIAAALQDAYTDCCTVEVVNPLDDKRTPAFLRSSQTEYDKFVRQMPNFWKLNYKISTSSVPASEATMTGLSDWPYAGCVMPAARAVKARVIDASTA